MQAFDNLRPDHFSDEGLIALYEYLTDLEDDIGEEIELDVIALCCDYCEYESIDAFVRDYDVGDIKLENYGDKEDYKEAVAEWISDRTTFIPVNDDAFIIQVF